MVSAVLPEPDETMGALQRSRLQAGWTRENLAWEIGVAMSTVAGWERAGRQPHRDDLVERVAGILGRPAAELFPGREEWKRQQRLRVLSRRADA